MSESKMINLFLLFLFSYLKPFLFFLLYLFYLFSFLIFNLVKEEWGDITHNCHNYHRVYHTCHDHGHNIIWHVSKIMLWNVLDTNIFLFLLFIFLDFIFLFFWISFSFSFSFSDIAVTWYVTWCDVISLEHSGKI